MKCVWNEKCLKLKSSKWSVQNEVFKMTSVQKEKCSKFKVFKSVQN